MKLGLMFGAAAMYLRQHPEELVRVARNAVAHRVGVPLDALRWLATQLDGGPEDVEVQAVPPGLKAAATIDLMGNRVRASAVVFVEAIDFSAAALRVELRLNDVSLQLLEAAKDSPVAMLLQSGALDLSKPGNLAAHIPQRPAMLVEAADERIVLDLMKHEKVAESPTLQRAIALITPFLAVQAVETDWEHLDLVFEALPVGLPRAVAAARAVL